MFVLVERKRPLKEQPLDSGQSFLADVSLEKTEPHISKEFLKMRSPWMRNVDDWALMMEISIGSAMMFIWLVAMVSLWHGIIFLLNLTQG